MAWAGCWVGGVPVVRVPLSISQFAELMGIDPERLVDVEVSRRSTQVTLVMEPEVINGADEHGDPPTESGR